MDAGLRMFHAALRGERELDALLDVPDDFRQNVDACRKLLEQHPELTTDTREALGRILNRAESIHTQRNRYIHDLLRTTLVGQRWELARISRRPRTDHDAQHTSFDDMERLVIDLIACTWRLGGGAMYLLSGGWTGLALGHVVGKWSGDADYPR